MTRTHQDIRNAIDTTLSGASHDPTLFNRVVNASKGDTPPVKKKLTLSMALVLVLVLLTGSVALAAAYRGVSWFLTEQACEPQTLDPDYLMNTLQQNNTSQRLNAQVVDAYWDGKTLSVAYRISPADPAHIIALPCDTPTHEHYRSTANADIMLTMPEFINITIGNKITRPLGDSTSWVYEEDGAITIMHSFPLNSMNESVGISLPISNTLAADGSEESAMVHCTLPAMADPVAAHEHDWLPATCVSPMTCKTCGRTEGGLGEHSFPPTYCNITRTCPVCTYTYQTGHVANLETPGTCYCGEIHP